ncbi:Uncharacterized protein APZ42_009708 [Daphnia magna]|uniref:Uncharacterized protein n=1 Tax=Daphnia magna TaxID=35525 RepID=A0A164DUN5_9CRUS|nr:Uncharacterized protein APZ42_009708 [Daphnia magna]
MLLPTHGDIPLDPNRVGKDPTRRTNGTERPSYGFGRSVPTSLLRTKRSARSKPTGREELLQDIICNDVGAQLDEGGNIRKGLREIKT